MEEYEIQDMGKLQFNAESYELGRQRGYWAGFSSGLCASGIAFFVALLVHLLVVVVS